MNLLFCAAFIIGGLLLLFPDTAPSVVGMVLVGGALFLDRKFFSPNVRPKTQIL
ncbi:hypothetical protein MASR2M79_11040 [Aminivibrio sp.]